MSYEKIVGRCMGRKRELELHLEPHAITLHLTTKRALLSRGGWTHLVSDELRELVRKRVFSRRRTAREVANALQNAFDTAYRNRNDALGYVDWFEG